MVKQTIQIFARVKPTKAKLGLYEINNEVDDGSILGFNVPRDQASGYVNNKKEEYKFKFQKVFDRSTKQDEVFQEVAQPVIENVLQGYNGTIFAYGQTGSGKTFTITGGPEEYEDRGIIPRALSYIFQHCDDHPEYVFSVHVSYLEIYNETGYDLLHSSKSSSKLEDLPKVTILEDPDQNVHLKNLSTHQARNEEEALGLLFAGDTNRMIAETPMNQASTRSHCIFTIHVSSREAGSATIRQSKLHLVDLAGSERVGKTGVNGQLLTEAKYINLSLHFLEQVIVSLSEKGRGHIPYRNSIMTSVLRNSLGGNCMTTMIATCSVEKKNLDESISTCRFAQRVALIKNDAVLNEELDPKLLIIRLKKEVAQLKEEIAMLTGEQRTDELTEEEREICAEAVKQYLDDKDPETSLNVGADMRKVRYCNELLKKAVLAKGGRDSNIGSNPSTFRQNTSEQEVETYLHSAEEQKLRELVLQRDNEINILVGMLKKEKKRAQDVTEKLEGLGQKAPQRPGYTAHDDNNSRVFNVQNGSRMEGKRSHSVDNVREMQHREPPSPTRADSKKAPADEALQKQVLGDMSQGRKEAFAIFQRDYADNQAIEENRNIMRARIAKAKDLGRDLQETKNAMNKIKGAIERHRMEQVMHGLVDPNNPQPDETEQMLRDKMEEKRSKHKETFVQLKALRNEIDHLEHLQKKLKTKFMKDFENWWAEQEVKVQQEKHLYQKPPSSASHARNAWRTPPFTPPHPNPNMKQHQILTSPSSASSSQSVDSSSVPLAPLRTTHSHHSSAAAAGYQPVIDSSGYSSSSSVRSRRHQPPHPPSRTEDGIQFIGDEEVDADIRAFMKAKEKAVQMFSKYAQQRPAAES